ncbi:murein biosynthesis integral membrane protein MurJ [Pseudarthrobacter scleromae]|uniref:murein biosynthesis integral membrane protein MurJ n=1 Tax=Pseudarthrobacter scleromae TaxID=158897 RepID=UPI00364103B8
MSAFRRGFVVLAAGSLLGKVVALLREIVFAGAFGTGAVASGFRVAQTASLVPANLISGDLLSAAFAPTYAREIKRNPERARSMLWGYSFWLALVLMAVAAFVFVTRRLLVGVMIPGAGAEIIEQAESMLAILCWVIPLYGVSAVQAYALGAHGNYLPTSTRQTIQSFGLLAGTVLAVWSRWLPWLALGLVAAWLVNSFLCSRLLVAGGHLSWPGSGDIKYGWRFLTAGARSIAPLFFLPLAMQASIVLERVFASLGEYGLIAAVDYARTISDSVMSVIAVPLGILGLTQLAASSRRDYRRQVRKMSDFILVSILPVSALLVVCADPIVELLFRRGAFGDEAQLLTTSVLVGLAVGLVFQVLGYSLSRALTAAGRNKVVLFATLLALGGQVVTQGVGIGALGSLAIGLGPSVYGFILTISCAVSLGILWRIATRLAAALPAVAATCVLMFWGPAIEWTVILLVAAWSLNIAVVPVLRAPVQEQVSPFFAKVRGKIADMRKRK